MSKKEPFETLFAISNRERFFGGGSERLRAEDMVKYYYPEGLEGETNKRAYNAFSDWLRKGAGKRGWVKASIGKYCWQETN